jgi:hypothetical protein
VDDEGRPYTTQVYVRLPRDAGQFSGTVIVEPLHAHGIAPIFMYTSPYILRSGHGWACIASQKSALDTHVKPANSQRYDPLHIDTDVSPPKFPSPAERSQRGTDGRNTEDWLGQVLRYNHASNAILAQVGAAIKAAQGPCEVCKPEHVLLVGHSQTGSVITDYIVNAHDSYRLLNGASVFDGYFPSGCPSVQFGPRDAPIIQVLSDGDILNPNFSFQPGFEGRQYRRPDSDEREDQYRLLELAGVPHMGTRYPPHSDTKFWVDYGDTPGLQPDSVMNSLPHNELFNMALNHLVRWVAEGVAPPKADRIETAPDGFFVKDEHGNSLGGVRCVQMDVPRAAYQSLPKRTDGTYGFGTVGIEIALDKVKLANLYTNHDDYLSRFNQRLDELINRGWFLAEDAEDMRNEALKADVP